MTKSVFQSEVKLAVLLRLPKECILQVLLGTSRCCPADYTHNLVLISNHCETIKLMVENYASLAYGMKNETPIKLCPLYDKDATSEFNAFV